MRLHPARSTLLLLCSLIATGCASSGASRSGAECRSGLLADERSLAEVVDSAGLARALRADWPAGRGLTLATIRYDSVGVRDTAFIAFALMSEVDAERTRGLLDASTKVRAEPRTEVHLVLGDESGPQPRRVREIRRCPPVLLNAAELRRSLAREARSLRLRRPLTVRLRAFVRTNGTVGEVLLYEGSGVLEVNQAAVRAMREASFTPAVVEGIPIPVWVSMPMAVQPGFPNQATIEPPALPR